MNIGLGTTSNVTRDFNIVGRPNEAKAATQTEPSKTVGDSKVDEVAHQIADGVSEIDGTKALKNAKVLPLNPDLSLSQELRRLVPARHTHGKSIWNIFKAIGRVFVKTCHAIRNGLALAPAKMSREALQAKMENDLKDYREDLLPHVEVTSAKVTTYSTEVMGAAMGLREGLRAEPFSDEEIESIREGKFKLTDISQDPNFEDCWFLGTLASFLTAKGPAAIRGLITLPPSGDNPGKPPMAQVKLGGEIYAVPLAELRDNRGSGVSTSAPWVKLLETAMQMHMVNLHTKNVLIQGYKDRVDMSYGLPGFALHSLLGKGINVPATPKHKAQVDPCNISITITDLHSLTYKATKANPSLTERDCFNTMIDSIQDALDHRRPIMLTTPNDYWTSLGTGLSPNHTVAVQDIVHKKDGTAYFQVLDPYNRSVLISSNILKDGGGIIMEKAPDNEIPRRRDSLASTTTQYEADINTDTNDF